MLWKSETAIGRVRARSRHDGPAARNRFGFLLGGADLRPPGLAPAAILVVRSLADPLPGRFADRDVTSRVSLDWERAAQERLEIAHRMAARPCRGRIRAEAEAVLFADSAEMLACLALDLACGEAAAHWWWQVISRSLPPTLPRLLCEQATLVPAMFDALDSWSAAEAVAWALPADELPAVFNSLARAFDAPALASLLRPLFESDQTRRADAGPAERDTATDTAAAGPEREGGEAGDSFSASSPRPGVEPGMADGRRLLVQVALALHRRPALARSSGFAHNPERCFGSNRRTSPPIARSLGNHVALDAAGQDIVPRARSRSTNGLSDRLRSEPTVRARSGSTPASGPRPHPGIVSWTDPDHETTQIPVVAPPDRAEPTGSPAVSAVRPDAITAAAGAGVLSAPAVEVPPGAAEVEAWVRKTDAAAVPLEGIVTDLGGVFYLINVLEWLGPPSDLRAWGWLEAFALAWVPGGEFEPDPLWATLRALDRRPLDMPPTPETGEQIASDLSQVSQRLLAVTAECHPSASGRHEFPGAGLLVHRARVLVTRAQVDVLFRLDQIRLPIRRAGLDRDPGWRPDFGRIIRFHYD